MQRASKMMKMLSSREGGRPAAGRVRTALFLCVLLTTSLGPPVTSASRLLLQPKDTCDTSSSTPNQCFNADGSKSKCCPGQCGVPAAREPYCQEEGGCSAQEFLCYGEDGSQAFCCNNPVCQGAATSGNCRVPGLGGANNPTSTQGTCPSDTLLPYPCTQGVGTTAQTICCKTSNCGAAGGPFCPDNVMVYMSSDANSTYIGTIVGPLELLTSNYAALPAELRTGPQGVQLDFFGAKNANGSPKAVALVHITFQDGSAFLDLQALQDPAVLMRLISDEGEELLITQDSQGKWTVAFSDGVLSVSVGEDEPVRRRLHAVPTTLGGGGPRRELLGVLTEADALLPARIPVKVNVTRCGNVVSDAEVVVIRDGEETPALWNPDSLMYEMTVYISKVGNWAENKVVSEIVKRVIGIDLKDEACEFLYTVLEDLFCFDFLLNSKGKASTITRMNLILIKAGEKVKKVADVAKYFKTAFKLAKINPVALVSTVVLCGVNKYFGGEIRDFICQKVVSKIDEALHLSGEIPVPPADLTIRVRWRGTESEQHAVADPEAEKPTVLVEDSSDEGCSTPPPPPNPPADDFQWIPNCGPFGPVSCADACAGYGRPINGGSQGLALCEVCVNGQLLAGSEVASDGVGCSTLGRDATCQRSDKYYCGCTTCQDETCEALFWSADPPAACGGSRPAICRTQPATSLGFEDGTGCLAPVAPGALAAVPYFRECMSESELECDPFMCGQTTLQPCKGPASKRVIGSTSISQGSFPLGTNGKATVTVALSGIAGGLESNPPADIAIVLDVSPSVLAPDIEKEKQFAIAAIQELKTEGFFEQGLSTISVLQYHGKVDVILELETKADKALKAVSDMSRAEFVSGTATGDALTKAVDIVKQGTGFSKLIILVTDGETNQGVPPGPVATAAKAGGVNIFGVGVGPDLQPATLQALTGGPRQADGQSFYFDAKDFNALLATLGSLLSTAFTPGTNITISGVVDGRFTPISDLAAAQGTATEDALGFMWHIVALAPNVTATLSFGIPVSCSTLPGGTYSVFTRLDYKDSDNQNVPFPLLAVSCT